MARPRRRTRITYEGVTFLLILSFIVLGSILRQINLLVLLSGLMIAPFFFNWRISRKMLERARFTRRLPISAHAGARFNIYWEAVNGNRRMPAWNVSFEDRIRLAGAADREGIRCGAVLEQINPGSSQSSWYECLVTRRGLYEVGPARAGSSFPLGLVSTWVDIPDVETLVVAPALVSLNRTFLARLDSSRRMASHAGSRRKGSTHEEFFSLRNWQSGDNRRFVHWRSSAKRDELLVRQGVEPDDSRTFVLVDFAQASADAGAAIELLASIAASIVCRAASIRNGSPPAIALFGGLDEDGKVDVVSPTEIGPSSIRELLRQLAIIRGMDATGILEGTRSIAAKWGQSCRIFVLSTRSLQSAMDTESSVKEALSLPGLSWIDITSHPDFTNLRGLNEAGGSSPPANPAGEAGRHAELIA